jgi:hypothetical protein
MIPKTQLEKNTCESVILEGITLQVVLEVS